MHGFPMIREPASGRTPAAALPAAGRAPLTRLKPLSLQSKGLIVFVLLAVYSLVLGGYVMLQKHALLDKFTDLRAMATTADELGQLDADILRVGNQALGSADPDRGVHRVAEARAYLHAMWNQYADLTARVPEVPLALTRLDGVLGPLAAQPSRAGLAALRADLVREHASLSTLVNRLRQGEEALARQYRARSDRVAQVALLLAAGGVVLFGTVITLFFARLTHDVLLLKNHARKIVEGDRHEPIPVSRSDEVGELMDAVNQMSQGLDERDKQLEIERHKYFYREKMAAIGDLAAGIAHEIGNPISAIAGIAAAMQEVQAAERCPQLDKTCQPGLILAQTARLSAIAREIADFASPAAAEHRLLDLNELLRNTCRFVRYDRRFRRVALAMSLDGTIPAVSGAGDRLVQVVMNLLINAVDALEGLQDRVPAIRIATSATESAACLAIEDNGCGMDANTLRHAFEPFFTTKPPGRGTGLGLALCNSILAEHGGRIELESVPGEGTAVRVFLPLGPHADATEVRAS
ncbi:MAG: ATP-binding protein [Betaproteobacteria bacterium]|nr:ATP-binding protein [Betaproteobacteria bacterium]